MRWLLLLCIWSAFHGVATAGGPQLVAGASYFDPAVKGTPLIWAQGSVRYYTDQGNLSGLLPGPSADAFVANAFSLWTSIPTAAVSAVRAGQLAEDVSGANFTPPNLPADILSGAVNTPVAIVYDADGSVTDALLGSGASNSAYCAGNSVLGGVDNFGPDAHFLHALIILNGNCASTSAQLPDLQYHLVRVFGRVLGLDWSQANLNVITRNPPPTPADLAGFPVMHETDRPSCLPVAVCYSGNGAVNPAQPKMDDQAALSRLYPVTAQNVAGFPGKQIFSQRTARIHGSVYFTDPQGLPAQPMPGVNVVARWIDPSTGMPSRNYVASSISGSLYCGNQGNIVTGYTDASGQNFDRYGSDDSTLAGFFDLAGLQIPAGASARYELTIEGVDPLWSTNAGPYGSTAQVKPSGASPAIAVTVTPGGDVQQDILMQGSAQSRQYGYGATSYGVPAPLPANGTWAGTLENYGAADFFQFPAQSNRTLSLIANAVDESGNPSLNKSMPVIGMWALANPGQSPAPANTPSAFNTIYFAESRLDAQVLQSTTFRVAIADYRGNGRPDFRYSARVLYGDTISPTRASVAGGTPMTLHGLGLQGDTAVQVANVPVAVLASSPTQLLVSSPAVADGLYDAQLNDTKTGAGSVMSGVLTVGAGANDKIKLISGSNPGTPVGGQAPSPFTVMAVASDGVTPVGGASVQFTSSPPVAFSACSGAPGCTVLTDQSGLASTFMTVLSAGAATLTAKLAPASYANPQQVQAALLGTSSNLDLSLTMPAVWIAQGASVNVPLTARVLSNGSPLTGGIVNYQMVRGAASLSALSSQTDSAGYATVTLQINSISASIQVSICVAPNSNPCQTFNATAVPASSLQMQAVSGVLQIAAPGQSFRPVVFRIVDNASPPHPVFAATVVFQSIAGRLPANQTILWTGEAGVSQPVTPVILAKNQAAVSSDGNGLASFMPLGGGFSGNVAVIGSASAGNAVMQFAGQQLAP